jgi:DNA-directed RNA polymerase subunit M/transcription elongation factor TFIIS
MEDLTNVSIEHRIEWITLLSELLDKKVEYPFAYARALEHNIHSKRQITKTIGEDVKVYRYGDQDVLDLDSTYTHENAANSNYSDKLRRAAWALKASPKIDASPEEFLDLKDSFFLSGTKHEDTERLFFERLDRARDVMNDKGSKPTKGIFACTKCKSFDVDTEQKQTRSADEPMTIFCTCNVCGQRFVR